MITCTTKGDTSCVYWLRFRLKDLLKQADGNAVYRPEIVAADATLVELAGHDDGTGQVAGMAASRREDEERHVGTNEKSIPGTSHQR